MYICWRVHLQGGKNIVFLIFGLCGKQRERERKKKREKKRNKECKKIERERERKKGRRRKEKPPLKKPVNLGKKGKTLWKWRGNGLLSLDGHFMHLSWFRLLLSYFCLDSFCLSCVFLLSWFRFLDSSVFCLDSVCLTSVLHTTDVGPKKKGLGSAVARPFCAWDLRAPCTRLCRTEPFKSPNAQTGVPLGHVFFVFLGSIFYPDLSEKSGFRGTMDFSMLSLHWVLVMLAKTTPGSEHAGIYIYIYTHIHIYIYTYIHIYICCRVNNLAIFWPF